MFPSGYIGGEGKWDVCSYPLSRMFVAYLMARGKKIPDPGGRFLTVSGDLRTSPQTHEACAGAC